MSADRPDDRRWLGPGPIGSCHTRICRSWLTIPHRSGTLQGCCRFSRSKVYTGMCTRKKHLELPGGIHNVSIQSQSLYCNCHRLDGCCLFWSVHSLPVEKRGVNWRRQFCFSFRHIYNTIRSVLLLRVPKMRRTISWYMYLKVFNI